VVAVDAAGQISFMNRAAEKMIGRSEKLAQGQPLGAVFRLVNERTREPVPDPIQLALSQKEALRLPANTALVSGDRELPVEHSVAPIVDDRGERLGAVIVLRDMTEDRKAQRQIVAADRLASLGAVAAGIAHEINNPLTYILGNVSFLSEELEHLGRMLQPLLPAGRQQEVAVALGRLGSLIGEVEEGAGRVSRIVADLGLFGRREFDARDGDAIAALDWALRVSHTALSRVARIRRNLDPIPKVRGDEGRLGQVFLNMFLNAAHAMQDGDPSSNELSVTAMLESRADGPAQVRITIEDTGSGMTAEVLDRIFDPFFTTKPVGTGTGLGLSVCHGVVQELGGSIRVSSEPGRGSTFTVRLPIAGPEVALVEQAEVELSGARGRVLVVDDEPRVLAVLCRMLGDAHDVVAVGSAREALEQLACGLPFDVIVCDLLMPDMSGMDLYRVLEQQSSQLARRMVFLSGGSNTSVAGDFLQEVPNQALLKPPERRDLLRAIDRELALRSSQRPLLSGVVPSGVLPRDPSSRPN
jgi:PAS domain S-box-containing protein